MRTLLFLALLAFGMNAGAQSLQPSQVAVQPLIIMNVDSQALVVSSEAVGIVSNTIFSVVTKNTESIETAYIGYAEEGQEFKGIYVSDGGKLVVINADQIFIKKPTFQSHSEADAALHSGQEYYLNGDRNVYHKP
jgi:hypothetical protein